MIRRTLPQRRAAETLDLCFGNQYFTITVGRFHDGSPAEVFVDVAKSGQDLANVARDAAILLSLALQYGTPVESVRCAVTRGARGEAASIIGAVVDCLAASERGAP